MRIKNGTIEFNEQDLNFVEKVGLMEAVGMVLDFSTHNKVPFIYDTYQLAHILRSSRKELFYFTRECNEKYHYTKIQKKNGGFREICAPYRGLKFIQQQILKNIIYKIPISKYATAYAPGSKLIDNAKPHCGKKYLLKIDLCDFFGSITFQQIYSCAFNTRYYPKQIGTILTTLCCRNDVLPQGAPTSPALSNIVMKSFDDYFGKWCEKQNFSYTRYCDDITISGNKPLYFTFKKAKSMLEKMGFQLNEKKTRFITNADCQLVTGLTVNERARIPSQYRRNLRQELYYVIKFGAVEAMLNSKRYTPKTDVSQNAAVFHYLDSLEGQLCYVLQIEPDNDYFKNILPEFKKIKAEYLRN